MLKLSQILTMHRPVLIDTSSKRSQQHLKNLNKKEKLKVKDLREVQKESGNMQDFNQLLQHPNVYAISEVT